MTARVKATVIFIACFALYFITRGLGLDEWDAVQFAMGTRQFDLWQHQPHPPGYPVFIFLGWALQHLTGCGPDLSLHLISCFGGALFVATWFLIVQMQFEELAAWLLAGTLAVTPIVWMSSTRALTDSLATGLLSAQLLCALRYRRFYLSRDFFCTALFGAAAAGVRPGLIVVVLIIGGLAVWRQRLKVCVNFFTLIFLLCLLWLLPTWYSQSRLRPDLPWWQIYPKLIYDQWTWRLDKPLTYIGAGDWSFAYLKDRFISHIFGWLRLGLGFYYAPWTFWSGLAITFIGLTSYLLQLKPNDRAFWKVNWLWGAAHVLIIFCAVPWEQRYYLPIFPLLLIPLLFGYLRLPKLWKITSLALPALLFCISLPLAIENHTEEAPPIRLARFLQGLHPALERQNVVVAVTDSKRVIEWYAPEFQLFYVSSLKDVDAATLQRAVAVYTDNRALEMPSGFRLKWLARFSRPYLITPKQSVIDLYKVEHASSEF